MDVRVGLWRKLSAEEWMLLNCGVGEDSWESLGPHGDPTSPFWRRSALGFLWKDWCWSWNSHTLATWCEELTHLKRPWCWERLRAGGEGEDRRWDSWMASRNNGHGFGRTSRFGDRQGGLVCCGSWGCKESDMTEWLNWTEHPKMETLYTSEQKQDWEMTVAQIMNSLLPNSDLNWRQ